MISRSCNRIETFYIFGIARGSHENRTKPAFCQPLKCACLRMTSMFINKKHRYKTVIIIYKDLGLKINKTSRKLIYIRISVTAYIESIQAGNVFPRTPENENVGEIMCGAEGDYAIRYEEEKEM